MVGGSTYDLGRLGAEIAFTVGKEDLDLNNLILEEPSAGGADLHTADWSALMQARLLNVGNPTPDVLASVLQQNLDQMVSKLGTDFHYHPSATAGYAVLSYTDGNGKITTIILVVPRPAA